MQPKSYQQLWKLLIKISERIWNVTKEYISLRKKEIQYMKILSVKQFSNNLKVTIQASGRLNFSDETARILGLKEGTLIKFAMDDEDGDVLYLCLPSETDDEDAFKVRKSGVYYYVPTKMLFDALGIDYRDKAILYDLVRNQSKDGELGGMAFRMSLRDLKGNNEND